VTHLSTDTLVAWGDHPAEADRETIVAHLATCPQCAARYAELLRSGPAETGPTRFDPAAFRACGLAVRDRRPRSTGLRWVLPALAAAALIAIAVLLPKLRPAPDESVVRGGPGLRAIAPVGNAIVPAGPLEFIWTAPVAAETTFRVEITDAGGSVIDDARVTGVQKFALPPAVQAQLRPGAPYHWFVSRLNVRGEAVQSSPLATFTIAR
jgi:hypothetical protein